MWSYEKYYVVGGSHTNGYLSHRWINIVGAFSCKVESHGVWCDD